jgi:hypothetical protein
MRVNQQENGWWEDMVMSHLWKMLVHVLFIVIAVVILAFRKSEPDLVVLMDTFEAGDVYDPEKLKEVLENMVRGDKLHYETLASNWSRETALAAMRPLLVIIDRSALLDCYNPEHQFGSTQEFSRRTNASTILSVDLRADQKLVGFMGLLGNEVAQTQFLIYSRGTDTNWLNDDFRERWVKSIENRFPKLRRRIETMVIPNDSKGTFGDPIMAEELRRKVRQIFNLPDDRKLLYNSITSRGSLWNTGRKTNSVLLCSNSFRPIIC